MKTSVRLYFWSSGVLRIFYEDQPNVQNHNPFHTKLVFLTYSRLILKFIPFFSPKWQKLYTLLAGLYATICWANSKGARIFCVF